MILNPHAYTFVRYELTNVDGVQVETEVDRFVVSGNLQPIPLSRLKNTTAGIQMDSVRGAFVLYTSSDVDLRFRGTDALTGDRNGLDRLLLDDTRFLYVVGDGNWAKGLIPHRAWTLIEPNTDVGRVDA